MERGHGHRGTGLCDRAACVRGRNPADDDPDVPIRVDMSAEHETTALRHLRGSDLRRSPGELVSHFDRTSTWCRIDRRVPSCCLRRNRAHHGIWLLRWDIPRPKFGARWVNCIVGIRALSGFSVLFLTEFLFSVRLRAKLVVPIADIFTF